MAMLVITKWKIHGVSDSTHISPPTKGEPQKYRPLEIKRGNGSPERRVKNNIYAGKSAINRIYIYIHNYIHIIYNYN